MNRWKTLSFKTYNWPAYSDGGSFHARDSREDRRPFRRCRKERRKKEGKDGTDETSCTAHFRPAPVDAKSNARELAAWRTLAGRMARDEGAQGCWVDAAFAVGLLRKANSTSNRLLKMCSAKLALVVVECFGTQGIIHRHEAAETNKRQYVDRKSASTEVLYCRMWNQSQIGCRKPRHCKSSGGSFAALELLNFSRARGKKLWHNCRLGPGKN